MESTLTTPIVVSDITTTRLVYYTMQDGDPSGIAVEMRFENGYYDNGDWKVVSVFTINMPQEDFDNTDIVSNGTKTSLLAHLTKIAKHYNAIGQTDTLSW